VRPWAQSLGGVTSVSKGWAARLAGQHPSRPHECFSLFLQGAFYAIESSPTTFKASSQGGLSKVTSYIRVIGWTLLIVTVVHGHATGRWSDLHGLAMVLASASIVGAEMR